MHRYRINYALLFGLVAGSIFIGGLCFFVIQPWQVNRNAEWFLKRADEAVAEGDVRTAFDYQSKYVRYRQDEDDARIRLANLAVDMSKLSDVTPIERGTAYGILQDAVRKTSDPELRRKFADMLIAGGRAGEATVHIDELLRGDPGNSELQALRARSLYETKDFRRANELAYNLIGYDKSSNSFDIEKAPAADQPDIYSLLASTLVRVDKKPEEARLVIDQMIVANPDSHYAHLQRAIFLRGMGEEDEAAVALASAYKLNPGDADVLKMMGQFAILDKDYDQAYQYLTEGLENNPEDISFYKLIAIIEMQRENTAEAIGFLDRAVKEFGPLKSIELVIYKIDVLFQSGDIEGVKKEIAILEDLDISVLQPLIDFQSARIKWYNQEWSAAANDFKQLRRKLHQFRDAQILAGILLGGAYEKLGQFDLAARSYEIVLQDHPNDTRALAGQQRVSRKGPAGAPASAIGFNVTPRVRQMQALPEHLQDWEALDQQIKENVEKRNLPKIFVPLYQAQVFLDREMYPEAREKIRDSNAIDPNNLNVQLSAVRLMWHEPKTSIDDALGILGQVEEKYGSSMKTRGLHAEILATSDIEDAPAKILALAEGIEDLSDQDKVLLYVTLGRKLLQLGKIDDAHKLWLRAAQLAPNNLPVRMQLFDVALQKRDNAAMKEAQDKILELVNSKQDASYILTEVKRRIIGFGNDEVTREELLEARGLLDIAMQQRPEWNELHVIYGQLLLVLQIDIDMALERLNDALKYGPSNLRVIALQVQLLSNQRRYQEAREKLNMMPTELRDNLLGKVVAEVLIETDSPDEAFDSAQKVVQQQVENPLTNKWFAKLATRAGKFVEAEKAWKKSIELNPTEPDSWSQLMILYAQQKQFDQLQQLLRDAHLALDAEFIPILTAKTYELQGRWRNAENLYLSAYGESLDQISRAKRMAEFYLLWKSADPANTQKAGSYLNRILKTANEGKAAAHELADVAWARRQAARLLAAKGSYHQSNQALQLLLQNTADDKLPLEDIILRSEILASLRDPTSQTQAVKILSELEQYSMLDKKGTILLAKLMHAVGDWEGSESLMIDALLAYKTDLEVRATQVGLFIEHGKYDDAQRSLNRLSGLADKGPVYLRLVALLASKKGDQAGITKALSAMLPSNLEGSLDPTQLATVRGVANMAAEYGDLELAEKLYQRYVKGVPAAASELTRFHAFYGDTEKAVEQLKTMINQHPDATVALAAQMLRKRRAEIGDTHDEAVTQLLKLALRDDPDSAHRLVTQAEVFEIQQKYDESVAAYDKLLNRSDVPDRERAAGSNNLAFILALMGQRLDEAEALANQAIEFYGPLSSLLDTRGVVHIAQEKYDLAIEDLQLATTVDRQPLTLYHFARALLAAGDEQAAQQRWQEAQKQGLKREDVPILEQEAYDEFASKIQQL